MRRHNPIICGSVIVAIVDLRTLAGRIGHSDLTMLQKHYAALVGSASEEAAEKIERAFGPPRTRQT